MSDLLTKARADLERLKPEVWIEDYGEALMDQLASTNQSALTLAVAGGRSSRITKQIGEALQVFEKSTGWKIEIKRKLKVTAPRWAASQALASAVHLALNEQKPKSGEKVAQSLEHSLDQAKKLAATVHSPAIEEKMGRFEGSVRRIQGILRGEPDAANDRDPTAGEDDSIKRRP